MKRELDKKRFSEGVRPQKRLAFIEADKNLQYNRM